ncbi:MAG: hypothetical protein ACTSRS_16535 [Candidatus Helarchaeota archaeon]
MVACNSNSKPSRFGVKAVTIASTGGQPMVTVKVEDECDETLLGPFLSAIGSFSKEILGGAHDVFFKSHNRDLYCFYKKYSKIELSIFALMDAEMEKKDIRGEAEAALDAFVEYFGEEAILNWNGDPIVFQPFQQMLEEQINNYYKKIKQDSSTQKRTPRGLFSKLLKRLFKKHP